MVSPNAIDNCVDENEGMPIVEVDLTADSPDKDDQEVHVVSRRISHSSRKGERSANDAKPGLDDCILINDRLAVPCQLRSAVLKQLYRAHPGQEAMLNVSHYLWWPHMHKDIVNLAEEWRSCTHYGKNAKYIIPKNATNYYHCLRSRVKSYN